MKKPDSLTQPSEALDHMNSAVKMADGADDRLEGLAVPYGGTFNGKDVEGEWFTKSTDLALDWFAPGQRPLIYHHGFDEDAGLSVVGRVESYKATDPGVWAQVQLDRSSKYFDAIAKLVAAGKLYFSSGSMSHLTRRKKSGEITQWPWIELSLTPQPANLLAEVDFATAEKHFETAGVKSATLDLIKAELDNASAQAAKSAIDAALADDDEVDIADDDEVDMDGGPYPEGSYEDLADDIAQALREQSGNYAYVRATFPGYALACCYGDSDEGDYGYGPMQHYRVAYTLDDAGEPVIGAMEECEPAMIRSAGKSADLPILQTDEAPLAIQSARLSGYAALLLERTQGVQERRIKEGRILSATNRERLVSTANALDGTLKAMRDLLVTTEPAAAEAPVVDRRTHLNRELEGLQLWASVSLP